MRAAVGAYFEAIDEANGADHLLPPHQCDTGRGRQAAKDELPESTERRGPTDSSALNGYDVTHVSVDGRATVRLTERATGAEATSR